MFDNIDWTALKWALVSCLPFILAVVFLVIHIADIMEDRKAAKSLRAKVKALKKGSKAYWDAPKAGPIHYIPDEPGTLTTAEAIAFFKEAAKTGISIEEVKENLNYFFRRLDNGNR